ncbi:hypothetical protein K469DRAFT_565963, partial [Zopfia rhizophila CBS 207.26]
RSKSLAPETLSGVFSRRCFWWLNGMLLRGYQSLIRPEQLDPIKDDFASKNLLDNLQRSYDQGEKMNMALASLQLIREPAVSQKKSHRLLKSCPSASKSSTLAPVLPRFGVAGFRYAQPFLFGAIISFMQKPTTGRRRNDGYGLIAATGLLYLSLAISITY